MAFNFRKSKKIFPGLRLSIGKRSASVRVGPKGLGLTSGTAGSRITAGVPGTGVSYTKRLKLGRGEDDRDDSPEESPANRVWLWTVAIIVVAVLSFLAVRRLLG